jgi:hypothetical protein
MPQGLCAKGWVVSQGVSKGADVRAWESRHFLGLPDLPGLLDGPGLRLGRRTSHCPPVAQSLHAAITTFQGSVPRGECGRKPGLP